MIRGKFTLDRENGKIMGVCAGIARATGWDVTLVRVGAVLVTLLGAFPWSLVAYAAAAFLGRPGRTRFGRRDTAPARSARISTAEFAGSMRDIDRRLAEVETYVTSPNSALAREIETLR